MSRRREDPLSDGDSSDSSSDDEFEHKRRRPWTEEEDDLLKHLVAENGGEKGDIKSIQWGNIYTQIPGRKLKQCRERWQNLLNPSISKAAWSDEEDLKIIVLHRLMGKKWTEFARDIPGRAENAIKNRWNSTIRRVQRFEKQLAKGGKNKATKKVVTDNQILFRYCRTVLHEEERTGEYDPEIFNSAFSELHRLGVVLAPMVGMAGVAAPPSSKSGVISQGLQSEFKHEASDESFDDASSVTTLRRASQPAPYTRESEAQMQKSSRGGAVSASTVNRSHMRSSNRTGSTTNLATTVVFAPHESSSSLSVSSPPKSSKNMGVSTISTQHQYNPTQGFVHGTQSNSPYSHQSANASSSASVSIAATGNTANVATPSTIRRRSSFVASTDYNVSTPGVTGVDSGYSSHYVPNSITRHSTSPHPIGSSGMGNLQAPAMSGQLFGMQTPVANQGFMSVSSRTQLHNLLHHQNIANSGNHSSHHSAQVSLTILESPDVPSQGVGLTSRHNPTTNAVSHASMHLASGSGSDMPSTMSILGYPAGHQPATTPMLPFSSGSSAVARTSMQPRGIQDKHQQTSLASTIQSNQARQPGNPDLAPPTPSHALMGAMLLGSPVGLSTPSATGLSTLGGLATVGPVTLAPNSANRTASVVTALRSQGGTKAPSNNNLVRQASQGAGSEDAQTSVASGSTQSLSPFPAPTSSSQVAQLAAALSRSRSPIAAHTSGFTSSTTSTVNALAASSANASAAFTHGASITSSGNGSSSNAPASLLSQVNTCFGNSIPRASIAIPLASNGISATSPRSLTGGQNSSAFTATMRSSRSPTPQAFLSSVSGHHTGQPTPTPSHPSQGSVLAQSTQARSPTYMSSLHLQRSISTTSSTGSGTLQLPARGPSPAAQGDGLVMLASRAIQIEAQNSPPESLPLFSARLKNNAIVSASQDIGDSSINQSGSSLSPGSEVGGVVRPNAQRSPLRPIMPHTIPQSASAASKSFSLVLDPHSSNVVNESSNSSLSGVDLSIAVEVTDRDTRARRDSTSTTLVSPASSLGLGEPRTRSSVGLVTESSSSPTGSGLLIDSVVQSVLTDDSAPALIASGESLSSGDPSMSSIGSMTNLASIADISGIAVTDSLASKRVRL